MVKYEMGVIVRADLPEDGFTVEMDKVKALIERFGGTIDKIDDWGRRRLAYPIQKQSEGMYTFITYSAPPATPREVESRTRLIENVLRFLTVRKDEVEAVPVEAATPGKTTPFETTPVIATPVEVAPVEPTPAEAEPVDAEPVEAVAQDE